jgi:hypothetical protein
MKTKLQNLTHTTKICRRWQFLPVRHPAHSQFQPLGKFRLADLVAGMGFHQFGNFLRNFPVGHRINAAR